MGDISAVIGLKWRLGIPDTYSSIAKGIYGDKSCIFGIVTRFSAPFHIVGPELAKMQPLTEGPLRRYPI